LGVQHPEIVLLSFFYERKPLCELNRCALEFLKKYFQEALRAGDAVPGAIIVMQTSGGLLTRILEYPTKAFSSLFTLKFSFVKFRTRRSISSQVGFSAMITACVFSFF
jgi:hypothetical protein